MDLFHEFEFQPTVVKRELTPVWSRKTASRTKSVDVMSVFLTRHTGRSSLLWAN